jgi:hypothetical protein
MPKVYLFSTGLLSRIPRHMKASWNAIKSGVGLRWLRDFWSSKQVRRRRKSWAPLNRNESNPGPAIETGPIGSRHNVTIVKKMDAVGYGSFHLFVVRIPTLPGGTFVAKAPVYQHLFDRIAAMHKRISDIADWASGYAGHSTIDIGGGPLRVVLTEFIDGYSSKDLRCTNYISDKTREQVPKAFRQIMQCGILPVDFQFMVRPDGGIKVIDVDIFATRECILENYFIGNEHWGTTVQHSVKYRQKRASTKGRADMIWGEDVYPKLSSEDRAMTDRLLKEFVAASEAMLNLPDPAPNADRRNTAAVNPGRPGSEGRAPAIVSYPR